MRSLFLLPGAVFLACSFTLLTPALTSKAQADFSFVHISDVHVTAAEGEKSNAAIDSAMYREVSALQPKPAFVVNTGDVCEVGTPQEYAIYLKTLKDLTIPAYVAPGNHDVRWNPLGKEGYEIGTKQPLFQSWDYQNIHFVLLDSCVLLQHWGHFDKPMLDWLRADLKKVGTEKPVIIGFHHPVGRGYEFDDNETELLDITAPYNVVLWLQGHGHSDTKWNVNGAPALMNKGLYQGSYSLIEVTGDRLRVLRRTLEKPTPSTEVFSVPLKRPTPPEWGASVKTVGDSVEVQVTRGTLPADAKVEYRVDASGLKTFAPAGTGWSSKIPVADLMVGEHTVEVDASLADGRVYTKTLSVSTRRPGGPAPLWVAPLGGAVQSKLVRWGESLYVSTMSGDVVCLDTNTGAQRWKYHTPGVVFSTPLVANGIVYFGSADHNVYALDAIKGTLKWKTETGGAVFAGAAYANGAICIGSVDTKIYGLDAQNGKVLWTVKGGGMYQSQATTDGKLFYVGGWDNYFRAIDSTTGQEVWKQQFGKAKSGAFSFYYSPAIGSPTVGDGQVYVTSNDGYLHAMNAATGEVLWEVPGPSLGYSGPLLHDGKVYNASLSGKGPVFCFDAKTGAKVWEAPTGSTIYDSSCAWGDTATGGAVYVGCVNGIFSAINAADGKILWQYRLAPGHVLASPTTDAKRVFISSQNGVVVALPLGG